MHQYIALLGLLPLSLGFHMTKVDPGLISVQPGDKVSLVCGADGHWEYCRYYSPAGQDCDFEWKRAVNGVRKQDCSMGDRVQFSGLYDDRECGITIDSAQPEDSGVWVCHMEEYVFLGGRGSGRTVEAKINLTVEVATTTIEPITTTTNTTTTATTKTTTSTTSTTTGRASSTASWTVDYRHLEDNDVQQKNVDIADLFLKPAAAALEPHPPGEGAEAVPRVEDVDSSTSTVIGVICAVLLVVVLVVSAFFIRHKRRGRDAAAAVVYEREARSVNDQRTMMPGPRAEVLAQRATGSNYHEFFPPTHLTTS